MNTQNSYQDLFGSYTNEGVSQVDSLYVNKIYGLDSAKIVIVDQLELDKTSNQIVFVNSSNKITINVNPTNVNRVYNLTDVGVNGDFVFTNGAQSLNNKTLTNATIGSIVDLTVTGVANIKELHVDTDLIYADIATRSVLFGNTNVYGPRVQIDLPRDAGLANEIGGSNLGIYPSNGTNARQEFVVTSATNCEIDFLNSLMGGRFSAIRGINNGNADLRFWTNRDVYATQPYGATNMGNPQMILSTAGYLGIGTASPTGLIQVGSGTPFIIAPDNTGFSQIGTNSNDTNNTRIKIWGSANGTKPGAIDYETYNGAHTFRSNNFDSMVINSSGLVGINTGVTSLVDTLTVFGAIRVRGNLNFASSSHAFLSVFSEPSTSTANRFYTLPSAAPVADSYLKSDASGVLSWGYAGHPHYAQAWQSTTVTGTIALTTLTFNNTSLSGFTYTAGTFRYTGTQPLNAIVTINGNGRAFGYVAIDMNSTTFGTSPANSKSMCGASGNATTFGCTFRYQFAINEDFVFRQISTNTTNTFEATAVGAMGNVCAYQITIRPY